MGQTRLQDCSCGLKLIDRSEEVFESSHANIPAPTPVLQVPDLPLDTITSGNVMLDCGQHESDLHRGF